jgi:hypothetical protein
MHLDQTLAKFSEHHYWGEKRFAHPLRGEFMIEK